MYPTLGHLFSDIFGTQINFPLPTYGFLLATAFFSAFLVLRAELKRKEKEGLLISLKRKVVKGKAPGAGEIATSAFFGFIIGFKVIGIIVDYDLFTKDVQHFILSLEGSLFGGVVVAALLGYYTYRQKKKEELEKPEEIEEDVHPYQLAANILLLAALSGIVGAKLFHQFENWNDFVADPMGSLFSAGGLTFYGGLIFGVFTVLWYINKKKISWIHMIDVAAPAIMLAYAVGRIGCMAAGDGCWGDPNPEPKPEWLAFLPDWMWAFDFPHNVVKEGAVIPGCDGQYCTQLDVPVFPTSFYETTISLIFFGILWGIRKKIIVPGLLFSIYLIMNGVERFFIEKVRVNNKYEIGSLEITQAEIISTVIFLLGVAGIIFFIRRHRKLNAEPEIIENNKEA